MEQPSAASVHHSDPGRVLLVVDDPAMSKGLIGALESNGYDVTHVQDAEAALTAANERSPRVIVVNDRLPTLDGVELCRELKNDYDVPVLLVARGVSDARPHGIEQVADHTL